MSQLIERCPTLNELFLANNEIDNEGANALINAIQDRKDFKNIDIENNRFSGDAITKLFNLLPVTKLNLIKNPINDNQMMSLSQTIKNNRNL